MAMVSNKFLAALSVRLDFHRHLRFSGSHIETQKRDYVLELQEAEKEANGSRDYWTNTKQPPKVPIPTLILIHKLNISLVSLRHHRVVHWRRLR